MKNPDDTKMVIVVRRDLNMSPGKVAAQVAHAAMMFMTRRTSLGDNDLRINIALRQAERDWINHSFAKIVVGVDSLKEFYEIYDKAERQGVIAHGIIDEGRTELAEPAYTCLAIGPDYCERIDPITSHLRLY